MSDNSTERYYAEMEAARNLTEEAYFAARPSVGSQRERGLFRMGFERAFSQLWSEAERQRTLAEFWKFEHDRHCAIKDCLAAERAA